MISRQHSSLTLSGGHPLSLLQTQWAEGLQVWGLWVLRLYLHRHQEAHREEAFRRQDPRLREVRNHLQVWDCTQGEINQNNQAPGPGNLYELAADLSLSFKKEIYGEVREVRLRSRVSLLILWLNGQIYQQIVLEGDCSLLWNQTCPACALTMYMLYKTKTLWYTEHFKNLIEIRLLGNYHCRMVFVYYDIEYCMCCEQNLKYWCCIF